MYVMLLMGLKWPDERIHGEYPEMRSAIIADRMTFLLQHINN